MKRSAKATMSLILIKSFLFIYAIGLVECNKTTASEDPLKFQTFPPCAACRILINSFKNGMERTKREKFDGGDSAWEEDKLGSYATSETRLIEIQEGLCKEVERGEAQCHNLAEELEMLIADWWFYYQTDQYDIFDYVCVQQSERCCPNDHYGPYCKPCLGYPGKVCSNNGKCRGAGTRKGNGGCACDKGYDGEICSDCATGFYESYRDSDKLLCSPCHSACDGACSGAGPQNCIKCLSGWEMIPGRGCFDINECLSSEDVCPNNQFCVNDDGNYSCLNCDKACSGCKGDGPDMCIKCAPGYYTKNNICMHADILIRKHQENVLRYVTYFGLVLATCIIFQRNVYIASVIGLLVGVYVSVSEYIICQHDIHHAMNDANYISSD